MEAILPGAAPMTPLTTTGASRSPKAGEAEAAGAAFAGILAAVPSGQPASVEPPSAGVPAAAGAALLAATGAAPTSGATGATDVMGATATTDVIGAAAMPTEPRIPATTAFTDPNPTAAAIAALPEASVTTVNGKAQAATPADPAAADAGPMTATTPATAGTPLPVAGAAMPQTAASDVPVGTPAQGAAAATTGLGRDLPASIVSAPEAALLPAVAEPAALPQATQLPLPTPVVTDVVADAAGAASAAVADAATELPPATELGKPAALPELSATSGQTALPTDQPGTDGKAGDEEAASATEAAAADPAAPPPAALPLTLPQAALQSYAKVTALSAPDATAETTTDASRTPADTGESASATRPAAFAATVDRALAALAMASLGDGDQTPDGLAGAATRALGARTDGGLATAVRAQVAQQLTRGLLDPAAEQKLTIRLQPENLGQVEAEFRAQDDRLTVILRAGTPEAEQALRAGARELADGIIDRSGRFQHVEIRVEMRDGSVTRQDRPDDRQQDQRQEGRQDGNRDGRRDGRDDGRDRRPGNSQNEARAAWARAWADLGQEG